MHTFILNCKAADFIYLFSHAIIHKNIYAVLHNISKTYLGIILLWLILTLGRVGGGGGA